MDRETVAVGYKVSSFRVARLYHSLASVSRSIVSNLSTDGSYTMACGLWSLLPARCSTESRRPGFSCLGEVIESCNERPRSYSTRSAVEKQQIRDNW